MGFLKALFGFRPWEFSLALRYLRTRRKDGGIAVIAIISYIGIALAVTALISTMSIMNGFREEMLSRLLAFGGHGYLYGAPLDDFAHRDDMLKRLKAVPGVTQAAPFLTGAALIQSMNGDIDGAYVRGVEPDTLKNTAIIRDNIKDGSLSQFGIGDYGGNVVMVGDGLAYRMGLRSGDEVTLVSPGGSTAFGATPRRVVYVVGGVFHSGVSEIDRAFVYLPLNQAQLFFDREDEWDMVEIKVANPYDIGAWRGQLLQAAGDRALFQDWTQTNGSLWGALQVERAAMGFILFFIVIIASLNIISGVVMLVKNKARDVAILRTMGADRSAISRVFFITGSTIGAAGTVSGLLLGVLFCTFIREIQHFLEWVFQTELFPKDVYFLDHVPAKMDPAEVTFIVIASLLAACVSTLFPSLWAAKLEPVEALRYE
jgi:lipoprotein-releasing system permease protein